MIEPVNFSKQPRMETFCKIVSDTFASALGAITSRSAESPMVEAYSCDSRMMFEAFADQTFISASETNTGFEAGLFFRTREITMLADFMLAGDGESKDDLDEDVADAVKELASQLLGALNVPVEEALKKKFALKVDNITKNVSSSVFQASEYMVIDFASSVAERSVNFRFFMDMELASYIESSSEPDMPLESSMAGEGHHQYQSVTATGNQNLDLLLDIDIPVSVRMGSAKLFLKDILGLGPGNIVELEQNADEPIELAVNDKVIARGEVVIVDGYFGFRIKEIVSRAERIKKLKD